MEKKIKIVKRNTYAKIPQKGSQNAVGWDIQACFYDWAIEEYKNNPSFTISFDEFLSSYNVTLEPFKPIALPTGLSTEMPHDIEMSIKPRSGLFLRNGILAEGTIDPDYRGEIRIMLINLTSQPFVVMHGERIAQIVFHTTLNQDDLFEEYPTLEDLSSTERGQGGFGSTGIK